MRTWTARVKAECRLPVVQSAGREFPANEESVIREGEPGWEEMVGCPLLEVEEIKVTTEARRTRRKRGKGEGDG